MIAFALIALVVAALFTGAAFYINFAEHPARQGLSVEAALAQWVPAYKRGFAMQATLAVISGAAALISFAQGGPSALTVGAVLILANWPFTLIFIMPVNRMLLELQETHHEREADCRLMLTRWNRLHMVRTLLGAAATAAFGYSIYSMFG